eukprot:11566197-Ditylum_brightwellii.AAC.1
MANTEGIPDEKLASLLSIPVDVDVNGHHVNVGTTSASASTKKKKKLPHGLIERQRMMDEFQMDGDDMSTMNMRPSATVIRLSRNGNGNGSGSGSGGGSGGGSGYISGGGNGNRPPV